MVHRDLKSNNILVNKCEDIALADFGLAKIRAASTSVGSATEEKQRGVGALRWMAPELLQLGGSTPASDVYALAVVMWEIVTLQIPYDGDDKETIKESIRGGPERKLRIPDSAPAKLQSLLQACWLNDPKLRPSCSDVIFALKQIIAEEQQRPSVGSSAPQPSSAASVIAAVPSMIPASELGSSELAGYAAIDHRSDVQRQHAAAAPTVVAPAEAKTDLPLAAAIAQVASKQPSQATAASPDRVEPEACSSMDAASMQPADPAVPTVDLLSGPSPVIVPVAGSVVPASSMQPAASAAVDSLSSDYSPCAHVSSLRVCTLTHDDADAILLVHGSELYPAGRFSSRIDVYDATAADQPTGIPARRIDTGGMGIVGLAMHPDGRRVFVLEIGTLFLFDPRSRTGQSLSVELTHYAESIAVSPLAKRVFCGCYDGGVHVFSLDLEPLGRLEQGSTWAKLNSGEQEELNKDPSIRDVTAICCYHDRVFVADPLLHRVSVWDATTLQHVFSFGRRLTATERLTRDRLQPPPSGAFRQIGGMCLYRYDPLPDPLLVIAERNHAYVYHSDVRTLPALMVPGGSDPYLLVYTLGGVYVGAQYFDARCSSLSSDITQPHGSSPVWIIAPATETAVLGSDIAASNSDLRVTGPTWSDADLKRFRSSLKVGDSVDFEDSGSCHWRLGKVSRIATYWFSATEVWLEHEVEGNFETVKVLAKHLWPAGMISSASSPPLHG